MAHDSKGSVPNTGGSIIKLAAWGGASVLGVAGAAAAFFLAPKSGAKRRQAVVEKGSTIVRRERAHVSAMIAIAKGKTAEPLSGRKPYSRGADERLASAVRLALHEHYAELEDSFGIRIVGGRVTLRGEVPEMDLITNVAHTVEGVDGVREVNNLLRLRS